MSVSPLGPAALSRAMTLYAQALHRHRDELNSLNVYPVPDGDTGTNMLRTQEAVVASLPDRAAPPEELAAAVERASLMGARGNSGVILAQALRGFFGFLRSSRDPGPDEVAAALELAAEEAYRAVAKPAEGTVLTVLRDAAAAASRAARAGAAQADVLEAAVGEARRSLERTRQALPELRAAGVVDAGAKGMVLLLEALRAAAAGEEPAEIGQEEGPVGRVAPEPVAGLEHPFEVQALLEAPDPAVPGLRETLGRTGDSLVVIGGSGLFNVHVHTGEPARALEALLDAGRPRTVAITWLEGQVADCLGGQARGMRVAEGATEPAGAARAEPAGNGSTEVTEDASALIAVAEGAGLQRIFRSLGAEIVPGGPGNNPSVAELLAALSRRSAEGALVLPNHPNVAPAAERAASEAGRPVVVVPALSIPAGLAAAAAFNASAELGENDRAMREAAGACRAGAIARAGRRARTPAGPVAQGDWLGMDGDRAADVAGSAPEVAERLVRRLVSQDSEIVTVIRGAEATDRDRDAVLAGLRAAFPELDVQAVEGGQPRYPFLVGVE